MQDSLWPNLIALSAVKPFVSFKTFSNLTWNLDNGKCFCNRTLNNP